MEEEREITEALIARREEWKKFREMEEIEVAKNGQKEFLTVDDLLKPKEREKKNLEDYNREELERMYRFLGSKCYKKFEHIPDLQQIYDGLSRGAKKKWRDPDNVETYNKNFVILSIENVASELGKKHIQEKVRAEEREELRKKRERIEIKKKRKEEEQKEKEKLIENKFEEMQEKWEKRKEPLMPYTINEKREIVEAREYAKRSPEYEFSKLAKKFEPLFAKMIQETGHFGKDIEIYPASECDESVKNQVDLLIYFKEKNFVLGVDFTVASIKPILRKKILNNVNKPLRTLLHPTNEILEKNPKFVPVVLGIDVQTMEELKNKYFSELIETGNIRKTREEYKNNPNFFPELLEQAYNQINFSNVTIARKLTDKSLELKERLDLEDKHDTYGEFIPHINNLLTKTEALEPSEISHSKNPIYHRLKHPEELLAGVSI